jgi:hypothetical protein
MCLRTSKTRSRSFCFLVRLLWQMSSHNSAISSRTGFDPRVASIAVTMHRCRNWAVVLYPFAYSSNASLSYLCMIIHDRPGVRSFSESPIIFALCINGFTCRISAAFPCSLVAMLCLPIEICMRNYSLPITLVYMSFLYESIFLALNTTHGYNNHSFVTRFLQRNF